MTKKNAILAMLVAMMSFGFATGSWAQGGWKRWGPSGGGYDPKTVETVAGEVVSVDKTPAGRGRSQGVGLTLKTDKGMVQVVLGPAWYLEDQGLKPAPGDHVEITGSKTSYEGRALLIAGEVKKGDKILKLRNEAGVPRWTGRKWHY
jgi:hypothetical protein